MAGRELVELGKRILQDLQAVLGCRDYDEVDVAQRITFGEGNPGGCDQTRDLSG